MTTANYRSYENLFLHEAAKRYGFDPDRIRHVGGFENLVYETERDGRELIIRITPSTKRTPDYVAAELDWMLRLADYGVQVARPVESLNGRLMEAAETEAEPLLMGVFEKAPGGHVGADHPLWGPRLFEQWGQLTGRMHRHSETYAPPEGIPRRLGSALDEVYTEPSEGETPSAGRDREGTDEAGPEAVKRALARVYTRIAADVERLPKDGDRYGMCHRDLHHGNFFADEEGRMTAFDFDDCGDDNYLQDIAMPVYYASVFASWDKPETDPGRVSDFAGRFLDDFLRGYERERRIGSGWLKQLPMFIEKRRLDLCLILFDIWGSEKATAGQREWISANSKAILRDIPCMSLHL